SWRRPSARGRTGPARRADRVARSGARAGAVRRAGRRARPPRRHRAGRHPRSQPGGARGRSPDPPPPRPGGGRRRAGRGALLAGGGRRVRGADARGCAAGRRAVRGPGGHVIARLTATRLIAAVLACAGVLALAMLAALLLDIDVAHGSRLRLYALADLGDARFLDYRLPRVLGGALVGACLAGAGCAFQAVLRNPLAEPYALGVSSGASLAAFIAIQVGLD